ncbi:hypothetical protein M885DRAFT_513116 [Pelagophyceae sp. CCMP2097]|nr:hypothetical protein M885DRAFT_513116 [Pelagophyceae sp. CCMP2097]|mmetsp:Transcript_20286/g.68755  ORF Transcript_20286/g.68755 Transcript_20286/m.68755 type:complete len:254 (-) Transcript_20286:56-817(-)
MWRLLLWSLPLLRPSLGLGGGLARWHRAVSAVPKAAILPVGFGSASDPVDDWDGLKLIEAAMGRARTNPGLMEQLLLDRAISSDAFASQLRAILPDHVDADLAARAAKQTHDAGERTWDARDMVRAAVVAVYALPGGAATIDELGAWLVDETRRAAYVEAETNPKGELLNRGGAVEAVRLSYPFMDHMPQFSARATLGESVAYAEGPRRKESERRASARLLVAMGLLSKTPAPDDETGDTDVGDCRATSTADT